MKKVTKKATHHDKEAKPMPVPAKHVDEGKELAEAKTPKADAVPAHGPCKRSDCQHPEAMHYGSKDRWCNTSGCQCQAYLWE